MNERLLRPEFAQMFGEDLAKSSTQSADCKVSLSWFTLLLDFKSKTPTHPTLLSEPVPWLYF